MRVGPAELSAPYFSPVSQSTFATPMRASVKLSAA